jgi:hypothetical protein
MLCIPTLITTMHHFHFPACRDGLRDDFHGPFQVQSLQVPNSEEQAALPDAADDEVCTARMELPLQYDARERDGEGKPRRNSRGPGGRVDDGNATISFSCTVAAEEEALAC